MMYQPRTSLHLERLGGEEIGGPLKAIIADAKGSERGCPRRPAQRATTRFMAFHPALVSSCFGKSASQLPSSLARHDTVSIRPPTRCAYRAGEHRRGARHGRPAKNDPATRWTAAQVKKRGVCSCAAPHLCLRHALDAQR